MDMNMMVTPNVQGMATAMNTIKTGSDVNTAVLSKALDNSKEQGSSMVKMMEQSVNLSIGTNFDVRV